MENITVGESVIDISDCVRNLGAHLDKDLTMKNHVNAASKSCYFHLRRIAKIRRHITVEASKKAILSTVISRIDFHNALLVGTTEVLRNRLQVIQNNCARLITGTSRVMHTINACISVNIHSTKVLVHNVQNCLWILPRGDNNLLP